MTRRMLLASAIFVAVCAAAQAQELQLKLIWIDAGGLVLAERALSLALLDEIAPTEILTATPWTEGEQRFSGPLLSALAELHDLVPASVRVVALNDYTAEIPAADWRTGGVILATRWNGATMRVRDKGPYWIIYPVSRNPAFGQQPYQGRMVWQVKELVFLVP